MCCRCLVAWRSNPKKALSSVADVSFLSRTYELSLMYTVYTVYAGLIVPYRLGAASTTIWPAWRCSRRRRCSMQVCKISDLSVQEPFDCSRCLASHNASRAGRKLLFDARCWFSELAERMVGKEEGDMSLLLK